MKSPVDQIADELREVFGDQAVAVCGKRAFFTVNDEVFVVVAEEAHELLRSSAYSLEDLQKAGRKDGAPLVEIVVEEEGKK